MTISEPAVNNYWPSEARLLRWLTILWIVIGLVMLCSASFPVAQSSGDGLLVLKRQLMWVALGAVYFLIVLRVPIYWWFRISGLLCLLGIAAILATQVPGLGRTINGATRWLNLGIIIVQPSELLKPLLILQGALIFGRWYYTSLVYRLGWVIMFSIALLGTLIQPDLGTAIVIGAILWIIAWAAGLPMMSLIGTAGVGLVAATISISIKAYQRQRILSFLDPWSHAHTGGYQLIQSLLAIGSGQIWGQGFGLSQQKLFYLPIQYTDFIFAVYAEEFGFVGCLFFITLLGVYTIVGIRVLLMCEDLILRLVACGCLSFLVGQSILNVSVTIGILPTTGLPLPFFSYGGSSVLAGMITAALLIRVAREVSPETTEANSTNPVEVKG